MSEDVSWPGHQTADMLAYNAASVVITGNSFRRHTFMTLKYCSGTTVTGNLFDRCFQVCIWIEVESRKSLIASNTFCDTWDASGGWTNPIRSISTSTNATALIVNNSIARGTLATGTRVINADGFYFDDTPAGISFKVFGNDLSALSGTKIGGATPGVVTTGGQLQVDGNVGFYGTTPIAKPTVSGSRGGNAALASLCTALASLGLITNSTS